MNLNEQDYHNNQTGRVIFNLSSRIDVQRRWWWWDKKTLVCPSDDEYRDIAKARTDRAYKVDFTVSAVRATHYENLVYFQ